MTMHFEVYSLNHLVDDKCRYQLTNTSQLRKNKGIALGSGQTCETQVVCIRVFRVLGAGRIGEDFMLYGRRCDVMVMVSARQIISFYGSCYGANYIGAAHRRRYQAVHQTSS